MFKVSTKKLDCKAGIVYILQIEIEDKQLVKIGVTLDNKVENRITDILVSIWKRYRIFPKTYVKRYKKFDKPYEIETVLHKYFKDYKYETAHKFSGSTEIFNIELDIVVEAYEILLKGGSLDEVYSDKTTKSG